jgi:hypothetical protein
VRVAQQRAPHRVHCGRGHVSRLYRERATSPLALVYGLPHQFALPL